MTALKFLSGTGKESAVEDIRCLYAHFCQFVRVVTNTNIQSLCEELNWEGRRGSFLSGYISQVLVPFAQHIQACVS